MSGGADREKEDTKMKSNTTYTFTKNGEQYSASGKNRFEAQQAIELAFRVDLTGAKFEEIYKLKTVRTGRV